jgi:hypothetical protein
MSKHLRQIGVYKEKLCLAQEDTATSEQISDDDTLVWKN